MLEEEPKDILRCSVNFELLFLPLLPSFSSGEIVTQHTHVQHNLVSYSNTVPGPDDLSNQVQTLKIQSQTQSVPTQVLHPNCTHSHVSDPRLTCHTPRPLGRGRWEALVSLPTKSPKYGTCCDQTDGLLHRQPATARILSGKTRSSHM